MFVWKSERHRAFWYFVRLSELPAEMSCSLAVKSNSSFSFFLAKLLRWKILIHHGDTQQPYLPEPLCSTGFTHQPLHSLMGLLQKSLSIPFCLLWTLKELQQHFWTLHTKIITCRLHYKAWMIFKIYLKLCWSFSKSVSQI